MESSESQPPVLENQPETSQPPRSQRPWLWLVLALLLAGGGFGIWRWLAPANQSSEAATAQPPGVKVRLSQVKTSTVEESSDYIANLESRRSVTLQPRIQGRITNIFVRPGDRVPAGTVLMQVDPDEQQAAFSSAEAAIAGAQAEVDNAQATLSSLEAERQENLADLQLSQQQYERYTRLSEQGAVSREIRDQYLNELQAAKASLGAINKQIQAQQASVARAEKAVLQARANAKAQQVQLQYYKITAPFAGTVGDIPVKVGDFVNTSNGLTTVTQNQPLEVNVSVPIERGPDLRQGMTVELMDGQGQKLGNSKVFFIAPNTANGTQSVLIKSLFDNAQGRLRADQYVRAKVIWEQRPGILIPTTAVSRIGGQTFVYVAEPSTEAKQGEPNLVAQQKPIELGTIQGNNYQVIKGLQPGERIVVSGLLNLSDGTPIIPVEENNAS